MLAPIVARRDPTLRARIRAERSLVYSGNEAAALGVRNVYSGSGLAWYDGKMVVVQDNADVLAFIADQGAKVTALPLRGLGAAGGAKGSQMQLEAMVSSRDWRGEFLLAFGSGATAARRRIVRMRLAGGDTDISIYEPRQLFANLEDLEGFATSVLSIEGAALLPRAIQGRDVVRLFQRGHGPPRGQGGGGLPATVDVRVDALLAYLERAKKDPGVYCGVELENLRRYDLGAIAGVPVGFTDAAALPSGRVVFIGAAEIGIESGEEGEVICSVLGVIEPDGQARYNLIAEMDGEPTMRRSEGLAVVDENRGYVITESFDRAEPASLCELELGGL